MSSSTDTMDERRRRSPLFVLLLVAALLGGLLAGQLLFGGDDSRAGTQGPSPTAVQPQGEPVGSPTPTPTPSPVTPAVSTPAAVVVSGSSSSVRQGTARGSTARRDDLDVTSDVVGAVAPGRPAVVSLVLTNTGRRPLLVTSASAVVTDVDGRGLRGVPACSPSWFRVGALTGPVRVPARGTARVELPLSLENSPTVNQDDCKGARFTYSFSATARQA